MTSFLQAELRFPAFKEGEDWEASTNDALHLSGAPLDYDIPFAPFAKTDRLGRIADWTCPSGDVNSVHGGSRRNYIRAGTAPKNTEEEEAGWSFAADAKNAPREKKAANIGPIKGPVAIGKWDGGGKQRTVGKGNTGGGRRPGGWGPRFNDRQNQRKREPSVVVSSDWRILEEIEFSRLSKLQLDPDDAICIADVGITPVYDKSCDKISTRQEKIVTNPTSAPIRPNIPPIEDDILMRKLAAEHGATVIVSDNVASLLMAAPRTTLPWDISIKRRDNLIFFDKRIDSDVDLHPVNETAVDAPCEDRSSSDSINSSVSLAREAARLSHNLPSVLCTSESRTLGTEDNASKGNCPTRYAKLDLGDGNVMLVRSQISSILADSSMPFHLATLLEYEHKGAGGMDWRLKLDSQRGAVFAHEIRNNGAVLARIVFRALLSSMEHVKLAYLSRVSPKDATRHALLGVHDFEPYELANQMNLNVPNGFGILRAMVDLCQRLPTNCDFVLMRDPNKAVLRLYKLPGGDSNDFEAAVDELIGATSEVRLGDVSDVSDAE
ncbi:Eukaryotic translation initiation factor 3 subunit D [Paramicrosporidium saccamoebae]|uniref:Eukaryotic translation initiation factor 3 subunit D n=1 Tax=Paramicrosporidium saccamoebae TaxID=1246581 RepID=A0A2H9TKX7_9FUNG|nr:Eukaryotic translation initiation factor 3 subunit D [Paramicrosporidium saccamoebae]